MARRKFLSQLLGLPFYAGHESAGIEKDVEDHDEKLVGR